MAAASGCLMLGEDGHGYELALKLESCGAWREWLQNGDDYSNFLNFLSSPSSWESFMSPSSSSSSSSSSSMAASQVQAQAQAQMILHLQLRARALLFDKASVSLFLSHSSSSKDASLVAHLNPHYLQLCWDDIFFTLEDEDQDPNNNSKKIKKKNKKNSNNTSKDTSSASSSTYQAQSKLTSKGNERPYECASSITPQRSSYNNIVRQDEESSVTWYTNYLDKIRIRYHKFVPQGHGIGGDKDSLGRTSEGMSAYLNHAEIHKRKRQPFMKDGHMNVNGSVSENGASSDQPICFFPEIMFLSNCVPSSALPLRNEMDVDENQKAAEFHGILDNLPNVVSKSTAMMERFGIKPDYIKVGNKYRGIDASGSEKKPLCQEQASLMAQKVVARLLSTTGFEGGTANSMEVLAEIFSGHVCKLGRILKLLTDSYRKQYSSIELIQMFLHTSGHGNLVALEESKKDGNKGVVAQTTQNMRAVQSQNQNALLQAQQMQRQMHPQPQMNMMNSQNITFQQQQLRRQQSNSQLMADVKIESMMESSQIEGSALNSTLHKQQHQQLMRLRQQQLQQQQQLLQQQQQQQQQQQMTMSQSTQQQFRQLQSAQVPQLQMHNAYGMRPGPVKVEAFHELMAVDSTIKHDTDHNQLTSPSK